MRSIIAAVLLCTLVVASSSPAPRKLFSAGHRLLNVLSGADDVEYVNLGTADESARLKLTFRIKGKNNELLTPLLHEVSDPRSKAYGSFLTLEEVGALFSDWENTKTVTSWLSSHGVAFEVNINGDYVVAHPTVAEAHKLLGGDVAKFHRFMSKKTGKVIMRTAAYALPEEIAQAVSCVRRTTQLTSVEAHFRVHGEAVTGGTPGDTFPSVLWSYYNIDNASSYTVNPSATQSVFETIGQSFSPTDLATFESDYGVKPTPVKTIIGPNSPISCLLNPNNCVEAELDVEYLLSVSQELPTIFWSIDGSDPDPFFDWVQALLNTSSPPLVNSISYGGDENQEPNADAFDQDVQKLGLQGVSVFVSSGDDGVAGADARADPAACGFHPSFPASCPHVTAVGATQGPEANQPEAPCLSQNNGQITTGGGFSAVFTRPSYQDSAVTEYLSSGVTLPPAGQYANGGRGYPDVAAMGHNYEINIAGKIYVGSGTSASSPVFAGMVSLINNARLNNGKSPLGFLNPALYQLDKSVFHLMTSGENNCCAGPVNAQVCCQYGFYATGNATWNPLTGLGSVDFQKLKTALSSL